MSEDVPHDAPEPLAHFVTFTHYVDANLMHNIVTRCSVTGVLHLINQTPIDWFSKKQATVETATYGSEFVAARTCVEQIIDLHNVLRYLGFLSVTRAMFLETTSQLSTALLSHTPSYTRGTQHSHSTAYMKWWQLRL